jgi:hypothetical protein
VLLNPVLADRTRIVFAAAAEHGAHNLVDDESASDSRGAEGNPEHGVIFADRLSQRNLTINKRVW